MKNFAALFVALFVVGACSSTSYTRSSAPSLFAALDTQPDGWVGVMGQSERVQILQTRTNGQLLCRAVMIEGQTTMRKEFCKIKGGEWR